MLDLDYRLASLDVVSLFTNVPIEWAYEISNRWHLISKRLSQKNEFLNAIKLILSSIFSFNKNFYRQIFGILWAFLYHPL